jgi:hypothetical protein
MNELGQEGIGDPSRACFTYATSIVVLVATTLLLGSVTLALGGRIGFWHAVGGLIAGAALFAYAAPARGAGRGLRAGYGFAWLAVPVLAVVLANGVRDVSFDGQNYQMEGIFTLARGWNPLRAPYPPPAEPGVDVMWVTHYPKGAWMVAAALYDGLGRIEAAKAFGLLLALAGAAFAAAVCLRRFASRRVALAVAAVAAANPITLAQLSSFYVDGQLAAVLTGLVCVLLWLEREPDGLGYAALASLIVVAVGLKFTGLVYATVIVFALLVPLLRRRNRVAAGTVAVAFGVAVLLVNYQPYVFNTVNFGNPFHPVSTETTFGDQVDSGFLARGRLAKLALSTFGRAGNSRHSAPSLKVPLSLTSDEVRAFAAVDVRTSGFGPLFGAAVLFAGVLLVVAWFTDRRRAQPAAALVAVLVASALTIPDPWWARLVPQLWLVPVIVAGLALGATMPRRLRLGGGVLLALLAADLAVVGGVSGYSVLRRNQSLARQLAFLREASRQEPIRLSRTGVFRSVDVRLADAGVRFVRAPEGTCPDPIAVEQTYERVQLCLTDAERARYRDELGE